MEININDLAYKISKLSTSEIDELNSVLLNKHYIHSNIYKYSVGIMGNTDNVSYDVRLKNTGPRKLMLFRTIKEILGIGLKEAKNIIDDVPCIIFTKISIDAAEKYKIELENIGAEIEII